MLSWDSVIVRFYTDPIILEFGAGVWLGLFESKTPSRRTGAILVGLGIVGLLTGGQLPRVIGYGIPAIMCVWGMLAVDRDGGVPDIPILKLLGDASYSIYLWHVFAIAAIAPHLIAVPFAPAMLFCSAVAFGLGSYFALERPLLSRTRRLSPATN
jgi:exopolysaccharide production protein ExoZ